ncbi:hypothetical protein DFA_07917 [Cavenderia fasciculata]|uniref:Uncharacterized protein n=1 Tax=Cavenderia fasciculata TaxID=261658 RepID=F4Q422_CACFS|nr:uncharacterized protein DFA_07917 [Cavenderia fasciculata]EGG16936.1 hypothetical protein DFA_07917 [Cavenderia fasciculata]|eukprot:XP_004355410.1 hypothetical protein DFA_07917 [Cavenderia fasciculata]
MTVTFNLLHTTLIVNVLSLVIARTTLTKAFSFIIQSRLYFNLVSYVYSYNQIHFVRIGKLVTLCVDSPPTLTMQTTASEVYTDVFIPERFRPPNIQIVTVSTYQKQSPTLFIHPCRICCLLDGQLIIQNSDGSGIPCDSNQSFHRSIFYELCSLLIFSIQILKLKL